MSINHKKRNHFDLSKFDFNNKEWVERVAKATAQKLEENPGMTLKEATGVSEEALEQIYSLAYTYYNQGKYQESISLFEFLTGACPKTYKYVLGLAASYHQIQAYREAFVGFYIALNLNPENPIAAYYATDCCLKQNLPEEAQEFAEVTSLICENRPEYTGLKHRADLIVQSLKKQKQV